LTKAGISVKPAILAALNLLSPAKSSYPMIDDFLTIIGWINPFSLIEFANSFNFSIEKSFLG